jgi:hypothetical protein
MNDGVGLSRRQTPDLFAARLHIRQENPGKLRKEIAAIKQGHVHAGLGQIEEILLDGQEGQDGVLSSLDNGQIAKIKSRTRKMFIRNQMLSHKWDAYNPKLNAVEDMRQIHMEEMISRAMRGDNNNERRLQHDVQTTSRIMQDINMKQVDNTPEKKGVIKRLLGR